jgi:hypothetical protein
MRKTLLFLLSTSLLCHVASAGVDSNYAQTRRMRRCQERQDVRIKSERPKECMKANNPHRLELKHIEGKGIGYNQGYSSFDAFFTGKEGDYIPFVDLRGHIFNDAKWATNVGVGTRYIFDPCRFMVGINGYFDYRSLHHNTHFTQIGTGIEAFFDRFDFRANGYLPVGAKRKKIHTHLSGLSFKGFSGHYILMDEHYNNTFQGAMKGFNAELGAHLFGNRTAYDVYLGAGPYFYALSEAKQTWGGKARLKIELTRCLFLEVSDSFDHIFHNRLQGSINLTIPFAGRRWYHSKSECRNVMNWQAVMPIERQEIIVVFKFKKKQTIDPVAIDPTTGKPFYVVFVNNTNPNLGNGTFENPFQNLGNLDNSISAQSGSFPDNSIYVFAGDNSATHMSGGNMLLQDKQRLLGSGNAHSYQTSKGTLIIPAQTANLPKIQGVSGTNSAIILANYNEVSGFDISFPSISLVTTGQACINGASAIVDANINNNILTNETFGLLIGGTTLADSASGTISVNNNRSSLHSVFGGTSFSYRLAISDATVTFANNSAINDSLSLGALTIRSFDNSTITVQNNTFANEGNFTGTTGYSFFNDMAALLPSTLIIKDNSVINVPRGFNIANLSTAGLVVIHENNTLTNNTQTSSISSSTGTCCVRFNHNKGYPTGALPAFNIVQTGGTLNLEPLLNNYPTPTTTGTITSVPTCSCAPCP